MDKFSIGSDPEFFISQNGKIVSSVGRIGGTKESPKNIGTCSVHEDNVCLEININPSYSKEEFISNILNSIKEVNDYFPEYKIEERSFITMNDSELTSEDSLVSGCSSDYNALNGSLNVAPDLSKTNNRSAGGHIHIGLPERLNNEHFVRNLTLMFDIYLGVPSVIMDDDKERRSLYGKASCYRKKDYGFEYRTLSNFWVFKEDYIGWVYDNSMAALDMASKIDLLSITDGINLAKTAVEIINNSDVNAALKFCKKYSIKLAK